MSGRVKFPTWLYVRIDNHLRAALAAAALSQGLTISDLARRELRKALVPSADEHAGAGRLGMTGDLSQSSHWADAAAAAMQFVSQVEAEWQDAPKEQLLGWHERLSCGLARIRAAHARTEAFAGAGDLTRAAVLDAYLRIAPMVVARLETLIANVASRIDAPASAG